MTDETPVHEPSLEYLLEQAQDSIEDEKWIHARLMLSQATDILLDRQADDEGLDENLAEALAALSEEHSIEDLREALAEIDRPISIAGTAIGGLHLDDVPAQLAHDLATHSGPLRIVIETEGFEGHHWQIRYEEPDPDDEFGPRL